MAVRIGVDFGTSNTVIAAWDEERRDTETIQLSTYGAQYPQAGEVVYIVPSLIHYAADGATWIGNQVLEKNLYASNQTFKFMKAHIANQNPAIRNVRGRRISARDAGADFLTAVLAATREQTGLADEEIALTMPVEAYEHYEDWLATVAEQSGITRFRLIDESSAAALGYGANIQPNDAYLIFDFGAGTLDVGVVMIEEESKASTGRRCRTLGKAGAPLGGMNIDQWLFQEVVKRSGRSPSDEDVLAISNLLLVECEAAKIRLSTQGNAQVTVVNPDSGAALATDLTLRDFEKLLEDHELYREIHATIRRAVKASSERGFDEESIKAALMVGGTSLIPSVQKTLREVFGKERTLLQRPLDAVARGAAAFAAGTDFYDHIQHDYAIKSVNMTKGTEEYRVIVKRGTPYPSTEAIDSMRVKATFDGQAQLGIQIYELGEQRRHLNGQPMELTFDPTGAARIRSVTPDEEDRRRRFFMNEQAPTFLRADPVARQGEDRFEIEFWIDGNKRLLLNARDLRRGQVVMRNQVVVRLT